MYSPNTTTYTPVYNHTLSEKIAILKAVVEEAFDKVYADE